MAIFDYTNDESIGSVYSVDTGTVLVKVTDLAPFRMLIGNAVVHARRDVDRYIDINFLARIKLCAQQIERQTGMPFADLGVIVAPAVVTNPESGDRVDVPVLERLLPLPLVECLPDLGDCRGRVKIQMHLAIP